MIAILENPRCLRRWCTLIVLGGLAERGWPINVACLKDWLIAIAKIYLGEGYLPTTPNTIPGQRRLWRYVNGALQQKRLFGNNIGQLGTRHALTLTLVCAASCSGASE
jgi:hypothetical protein